MWCKAGCDNYLKVFWCWSVFRLLASVIVLNLIQQPQEIRKGSIAFGVVLELHVVPVVQGQYKWTKNKQL